MSTRTTLTLATLYVVALVALSAALTTVAAEAVAYHGPVRTTVHTPPVRPLALPCAEDAPCWHWSTMGNHRRGIVTVHARRVIVGPCRFARYWRTGRIDRTRTPTLRGDGWARRHGCDHA